MAKYTELFSEYLEHGGELPAVFSQIENFDSLFIATYCDCELGFETPVLFQIKLEARANLVIPAYAKRIAEFVEAETALINPTKKRVKTGDITRDYGERNNTNTNTKQGNIQRTGQDKHTFDNSDHTQNEQDLPFAGAVENASVTRIVTDKAHIDTDTFDKSDTESYNNYEDKVVTKEEARQDTETYNSVTDTESGYTPTEAGNLFKALEDKVVIILNECLKEFENLFMTIY